MDTKISKKMNAGLKVAAGRKIVTNQEIYRGVFMVRYKFQVLKLNSIL